MSGIEMILWMSAWLGVLKFTAWFLNGLAGESQYDRNQKAKKEAERAKGSK